MAYPGLLRSFIRPKAIPVTGAMPAIARVPPGDHKADFHNPAPPEADLCHIFSLADGDAIAAHIRQAVLSLRQEGAA